MTVARLLTERKIATEECKIFESFFIDLGGWSIENGGAIFKETSTSITVVGSFFQKCTASTRGGSIYLQKSSFEYHHCCAESCKVTTVIDNYYGNHIYFNYQENVLMVSTSNFMCGPDYDTSADSVIGATAENLDIKSMNNSHCNSNGGSAGLTIESLSAGTIDDLVIYKGKAAHITCHQDGLSKITYHRLIVSHLNAQSALVQTESLAQNCVFIDSYFFPDSFGSILLSNRAVSCHNCYANFEHEYFTKTSTNLKNDFFQVKECFPKMVPSKIKVKCGFFINYFNFNFIFINLNPPFLLSFFYIFLWQTITKLN